MMCCCCCCCFFGWCWGEGFTVTPPKFDVKPENECQKESPPQIKGCFSNSSNFRGID